MAKEKIEINRIRKLYTIPGGAPYQLRVRNAIHISPSNTLKHEIAKCIGAYMLRKYGDLDLTPEVCDLLDELDKMVKNDMREFPKDKSDFITECVPKDAKDRRIDLVRLNDNTQFEFETNHKIKKEGCVTIYL